MDDNFSGGLEAGILCLVYMDDGLVHGTTQKQHIIIIINFGGTS